MARILFLLYLLLAASVAGASQPASMPQRYDTLLLADDATRHLDDRARWQRIGAEFDRLFPDLQQPVELNDADLRTAFKASDLAAFYSYRADHAQLLASLLQELERRGLATVDDYESLEGAFVQSRLFDEARALQQAHPQLPALPAMRIADIPARAAWRYDPDGNAIALESAEFGDGPAIVVIAHPLCHPSQRAFDAIEADPVLHALFAEHAMLVAPPSRKFEVPQFQAWNAAHPDFPMRLAYDHAQWPQVRDWATPHFLFYREGRLVETVSGWADQGVAAKLLRAAQGIGLSTGGGAPTAALPPR